MGLRHFIYTIAAIKSGDGLFKLKLPLGGQRTYVAGVRHLAATVACCQLSFQPAE